MRIRRLAWAAALGLSLLAGRLTVAAEPDPASVNQQLADSVAAAVRCSPHLHSYTVDVSARGGVVELQGGVADPSQRLEVVRLARSVPGVVAVLDRLSLPGQDPTIIPVQGPSLPPARLPDTAGPGSERRELPPPVPNGISEPVPLQRTPSAAFSDLNPPQMPPYAWPSYAPYNNFSRVGTPLAYPYQSWPFIGPPYPFPKVPLGWRSVKLEWDDGYWWYGQVGNKWNWWKLRYW